MRVGVEDAEEECSRLGDGREEDEGVCIELGIWNFRDVERIKDKHMSQLVSRQLQIR